MDKVKRLFCWHQDFVHKGFSAPAPGLYTCGKTLKNVYKIRIQRYFVWNLQHMVKVIRAFCWHQKIALQGVFCPCPGAICMYKIFKNVYKIRFQRDHFETCNIWAKSKGLSIVIKILSPVDYLPLPGAIYIWWNMKKMYIKSDFKAIFLNLQQIGKVIRGCLPLLQGYIHI